jgi:eukaryotic translation initiation factor 2C
MCFLVYITLWLTLCSSQYSQVKDYEIPQIRTAFEKVAKTANMKTPPKLKITALVVAKRHHIKFFPAAADAMPKNGNCKPGTLIDTAITSPYYLDFYLQSHNGLKGTAKSAHYFLLVNEMGLSDTAIQSFVSIIPPGYERLLIKPQTHKLCYTYVRATMGVSYAPPAYYADRLCERGR